MYLLDTDVFSITSPVNGLSAREAEDWRGWVRDNETALYFSVVTILEVRFGLEKASAKGATRKANQLRRWLSAAETIHRSRIVPVTIEIAHTAGEMLHRAIARGMAPSTEDSIVAATAAVMRFKVLSRNARDMEALGADWHDPLGLLPPTP